MSAHYEEHIEPHLPWTLPYAQWSDDQLVAGVKSCLEFRWDSSRRQIEREMSTRIERDLLRELTQLSQDLEGGYR